MKTLPLRELVRHPSKVKKLTAAGQAVRITDNGKPLWVVSPAPCDDEETPEEAEARRRWMDEELDAVLKEPVSRYSAAQLILDSRR
jgi:antitoxin (DNA-binding transcriptional repressor) of toxin-antitoxin stability system